MGLVRQGMQTLRGAGFLVTWDVNSRDRSTVDRLWAFLWGKTVRRNGTEYVYPGFVRREGVRYLGQSVVFVVPRRLAELTNVLAKFGVDHAIDQVTFH